MQLFIIIGFALLLVILDICIIDDMFFYGNSLYFLLPFANYLSIALFAISYYLS